MKEQDVFLHLDVHNSTDDKPHVESSVPRLALFIYPLLFFISKVIYLV